MGNKHSDPHHHHHPNPPHPGGPFYPHGGQPPPTYWPPVVGPGPSLVQVQYPGPPPMIPMEYGNGKMAMNGTTTATWRRNNGHNNNKQQPQQNGGAMNTNRHSSPTPPKAPGSIGSDGAKSSKSAAASPTPPTSGKKGGGGGGFLAQLFHYQNGKSANNSDKDKHKVPNGAIVPAPAVPSPTTAPAPVPASPVPHQPFVLLPDRPAIRLDSRLVCKYEVLAVVGKGSFSQVLRVQDRISKRFYAVKLVSTEQDFGAVNNELSILSRVQHPFVIRLEEVFRSATKLFIVLEMASGGEMYDRVVAKGRYTETEARLAVRMLLTGLDYLHGMHITHRDLKPENLLYSEPRADARLLITDFGLAHQAFAADEKMAETCGTPEYIAPEILLRVPYTNRVDLWAVGVIAYILMSGIMPFDDDCRSRLYTHIITANYVYYPQFWSGSESAKQFVDHLLETAPERRPTAADALRHHWLTGERPSGAQAVQARARTEVDAEAEDADDDDGATTTVSNADANGTTVQRTKSSRSVRSVTRSDHGHRVDPREVDQLAEDLQRLAQRQRERERSRAYASRDGKRTHYNSPYTSSRATAAQKPPVTEKNYGVF